jgi:ribosomal protein S27E
MKGGGNKMAVCKFCGEIIRELEQVRTGVETSRFFIEDNFATYEEEDFESDGDFLEFRCPNCSEVLFTDWDEAEQFLKEKDELQEMMVEKLNQIKKDKKEKKQHAKMPKL